MAWTRAAERDLFVRVLAVVNRYDLAGVAPGAPDGAPLDEYAVEARSIQSALVNRGRIEFAELGAIWLRWFGDDLRSREAELAPFLADLNALLPQNPT